MRPRVFIWFIIILVAAALLIDWPSLSDFKVLGLSIPLSQISRNFPIKLGLDLQGGTELTLQAVMDSVPPDQRDSALDSVQQVIERRVNAFGVSEAQVQEAKVGQDRRILVDLPGVSDASAAAQLVGKTAQLEFRELNASASAEATNSAVIISYSNTVPTGLTGADLTSATVVYNNGTNANAGQPEVQVTFNAAGTKKFADITKRDLGKQLPIFLDQQLIEAPVVSQQIFGTGLISGNFTADEAKNLAIQLNAGALRVPVKILSETSIAPSLGQQSVNKSLVAGIIGIVIVLLYMLAYYGAWGIVADIALFIYTLLVFAVFKSGLFLLPPVTLTLAGIAGFILSVGMAVDANILIFERMKEERRWGKSPKAALSAGFSRAWPSIRDSNISSLITSFILYYFGTGLVRGFAVTLAIGVVVSMFTAVVVTKNILRLVIR